MASVGLGIALFAALLTLVLPSPASASLRHHRNGWAPRHNHGLTIAATPSPISAGQGVLIYGQLKGSDNAYKRIWLFHRINPADHFTPVSVTRTNGAGFYDFVRADGVVVSNRNWFVVGPGNTHSRTIHELVSAVVTLSAGTAAATTAQTVDFTGTISPAHPHQRVLLQEQNSTSGTGWRTIASGYTDGSSNFSIANRFRTPGAYTLRAFLPSDPRNIASPSPDISLTVQQEQNPSFTINASAPVITDGQSVTISGILYAAGSTTTRQPGVQVTLYGKQLNGGSLKALTTTVTDASGEYTFTQMPLHNMVYRVKTTVGPQAMTAALYVGVQDVVTAALSSTTAAVGASVKISGAVTPDHSGHAIHLQVQNSAGNWVDVQGGSVSTGSTYSFSYTPGQTGTFSLRVQITGGPFNVGGVSSPVSLTVSGVVPITSLPPAS